MSAISTTLQRAMYALYVLVKQVSRKLELNTAATSLMIWKEHDDRSPLPLAHKWTEICQKRKKKHLNRKSNAWL